MTVFRRKHSRGSGQRASFVIYRKLINYCAHDEHDVRNSGDNFQQYPMDTKTIRYSVEERGGRHTYRIVEVVVRSIPKRKPIGR